MIASCRLKRGVLPRGVSSTSLAVREVTQRQHKNRHCEERSDEAIQSLLVALDCFATLVITQGVARGACQIDDSPHRHHRERQHRQHERDRQQLLGVLGLGEPALDLLPDR